MFYHLGGLYFGRPPMMTPRPTHKPKQNLPGRRQPRVGGVRAPPLPTRRRRGHRGRPAQRPSPCAAAARRPAPAGQPAAADGAVQAGVARPRLRPHDFVDGGDHVDRHGRRRRRRRGRGHGGSVTSADVGEAPPAADGGRGGGGRVRVGAAEGAAALEGARVACRRGRRLLLVRPQRAQRGPQALQLIFPTTPVGRSAWGSADDAAVPVAGRGLVEGVEARGDLHRLNFVHRDHSISHSSLSASKLFINVATH